MCKHCLACGSKKVSVETPREFDYENSGLSCVRLIGNGVEILRCDDCGDVTTLIQDEQQLLHVLGLAVLLAPPGMTGEGLRYLRSLFGISQAVMAKELGSERRETVADWESKGRIFASAKDEIPMRLLLLEMFERYVIDSEYCFLVEPHIELFNSYRESFSARIREMLAGRAAKDLRIRRKLRKGPWSPVFASA